jgi:pimeloyl-ACP methyl ester carboxylesterase
VTTVARRRHRRSIAIVAALGIVLAALLAFAYTPDLAATGLEAKYATPPSRFVPVAGMRVHVRDEGQGPVLVLLHGTASSLHTWDAWAEALRDSFRVVRFDLPGFGLTGPHPARDYSLDAYTAFVGAVLDSLRLDRVAIAGNSLGGDIAGHVAARWPDRVTRLVLLDPAGLPTGQRAPLAFRIARLPGASLLMRSVSPRALVESSLREVFADDAKVTPALVDRHWELTRRPGNRQAFVDRVTRALQPDTAWLRDVRAPTLIIWGEEDAWIPARLGDEFVRRIPDARLVRLAGVGHVPMEEAPERSLAVARPFLDSLR